MLEAKFSFGAIQQKNNQSVGEFAADLRAAAVDCQFGLGLDGRLRDQFVIGLMRGSFKDVLLQQNENITYLEAFDEA